ncbi:hypothetical protein Tco_1400902 [Tanacetum coccineum]
MQFYLGGDRQLDDRGVDVNDALLISGVSSGLGWSATVVVHSAHSTSSEGNILVFQQSLGTRVWIAESIRMAQELRRMDSHGRSEWRLSLSQLAILCNCTHTLLISCSGWVYRGIYWMVMTLYEEFYLGIELDLELEHNRISGDEVLGESETGRMLSYGLKRQSYDGSRTGVLRNTRLEDRCCTQVGVEREREGGIWIGEWGGCVRERGYGEASGAAVAGIDISFFIFGETVVCEKLSATIKNKSIGETLTSVHGYGGGIRQGRLILSHSGNGCSIVLSTRNIVHASSLLCEMVQGVIISGVSTEHAVTTIAFRGVRVGRSLQGGILDVRRQDSGEHGVGHLAMSLSRYMDSVVVVGGAGGERGLVVWDWVITQDGVIRGIALLGRHTDSWSTTSDERTVWLTWGTGLGCYNRSRRWGDHCRMWDLMERLGGVIVMWIVVIRAEDIIVLGVYLDCLGWMDGGLSQYETVDGRSSECLEYGRGWGGDYIDSWGCEGRVKERVRVTYMWRLTTTKCTVTVEEIEVNIVEQESGEVLLLGGCGRYTEMGDIWSGGGYDSELWDSVVSRWIRCLVTIDVLGYRCDGGFLGHEESLRLSGVVLWSIMYFEYEKMV